MDPRVLEYGNFDYQKIRMENEDSFFLHPVFDTAIMGINPLTKSVIYSYQEMFRLEVLFRFDNDEEYDIDYDMTDEQFENVKETIINAFKEYQTIDNSVPPTLFDEF